MSKKKPAAKAQAVVAVAQSTVNLDQLVSDIGSLDVAQLDTIRNALTRKEQELASERCRFKEQEAEKADEEFLKNNKKLIASVKAAREKLIALADKSVGKSFVFETELAFKVELTIDSHDVDQVDAYNGDLKLADVIQYSVDVSMTRPSDLTDEQNEVLANVFDTVEDTVRGQAEGACGDIFMLFPKIGKLQTDGETLLTAFQEANNELEDVVNDHHSKYDYSQIDVYELTN